MDQSGRRDDRDMLGSIARRVGVSGMGRRREEDCVSAASSQLAALHPVQRNSTHVVSTGDPHDVTLELVAERVDGDLLSHALLVEDAAVTANGQRFALPGGA